jgi:signal peptidase I
VRRLLGWLLALALAAGLGLFARTYVFTMTRVAGDSMEETLRTGDIALLTRFDYVSDPPARFNVVQLKFPGRDGKYLKRVIGLPGETVDIISGVVHINGTALNEPYARPSDDDYHVVLGENEYFVLGDNRAESYDSREADMGAVGADAFLGRVRAILWPLNRLRFGID